MKVIARIGSRDEQGSADMTGQKSDVPHWLDGLVRRVAQSRLVVIRFSEDEWTRIADSRRGTARFTFARPHPRRRGLSAPTACLVIGRALDEVEVRFGVVESIAAVTTLESRVKIVSAQTLSLASEEEVVRVVSVGDGRTRLRAALKAADSLVTLGPVLSTRVVEGLARQQANWPVMGVVARALGSRRVYAGAADLQSDAVATALRAFGIGLDKVAESLEVAGPGESTLEEIRITEDGVIEHDARFVEGFRLAESDLTGKAVFRNDSGEMLELITANRRPLEQVFGVDLIYVNAVMENVVMVQYKMLERKGGTGEDWVFRPKRPVSQGGGTNEVVRCGPRGGRRGVPHQPGGVLPQVCEAGRGVGAGSDNHAVGAL